MVPSGRDISAAFVFDRAAAAWSPTEFDENYHGISLRIEFEPMLSVRGVH